MTSTGKTKGLWKDEKPQGPWKGFHYLLSPLCLVFIATTNDMNCFLQKGTRTGRVWHTTIFKQRRSDKHWRLTKSLLKALHRHKRWFLIFNPCIKIIIDSFNPPPTSRKQDTVIKQRYHSSKRWWNGFLQGIGCSCYPPHPPLYLQGWRWGWSSLCAQLLSSLMTWNSWMT